MKAASRRVTKKSKPELPNYIAANLKVLRKARGWSQAELADQVGLNRGNIASYESGMAEPNICKTLRISKLFKINPRDLIRRNLTDEHELTLARIAHTQAEDHHGKLIADHRRRSVNLGELVQSSRALFQHKKSTGQRPCAEADMFAMQYEQLYQLTNQLLDGYQSLLAEVSCQCDGE